MADSRTTNRASDHSGRYVEVDGMMNFDSFTINTANSLSKFALRILFAIIAAYQAYGRRKLTMRILILSYAAMLLMSMVCPADEPAQPSEVSVPDANLRKVITETLMRRKIPCDILTSEVMEQIRFLKAPNQGIKSLQGLEYCADLCEVHLHGNEIADLKPLSDCVKITSLDLSANRISNITPLAKLTELRALNVDNNQIEDLIVDKLTTLGALYASRNRLSSLNSVAGLADLHSLYASNNQIEDISALSTLTQLNSLDLRNNAIKEVAPLAKLRQLRWTFLANNQIEDLSIFVGMVDADARKEFAPYWRLFVDDNPLAEQTTEQLKSLRKAGVSVSARQTAADPATDDEDAAKREGPRTSDSND